MYKFKVPHCAHCKYCHYDTYNRKCCILQYQRAGVNHSGTPIASSKCTEFKPLPQFAEQYKKEN